MEYRDGDGDARNTGMTTGNVDRYMHVHAAFLALYSIRSHHREGTNEILKIEEGKQ
jgi:hypothetical protein